MRLIYTYGVAVVLLCSLSCKDSKKTTVERMVVEWIGKEVIFPTAPECSDMGKDTLCPDLSNASYKILVYTDSVGCTSCKLNLPLWKAHIREVDSMMINDQVDFLFYFQPKNRKELEHLLRRERLDYTVFIDDKGELSQINNFPREMEYQCFLLDRNNKVLSIGNPTLNPAIWEIYKQVITSTHE